MRQKIKGEIFLILATIIWGSAFIFQKMGMDHIGPMTFTAFRFGIGTLCMIPVIFVSDSLRRRKALKQEAGVEDGKNLSDGVITPLTSRALVAGGILVGLANFAASALQQIGIVYTTAGKAGFLTAMDMVMVPFILLFLKERIRGLTWLGIAVAVFGMYLLCMNEGFSMQIGDLYCLGGALGFAFQIVLIDRYVKGVDPLKLAFYEFAVTAILSFIAAFIFEEIEWGPLIDCAVPILYTAVFEVCIAFSLQIVGQQYAPSALAAITMALESVFAALSGMIFLGEVMSGREVTGCIVMFAAFIIAQIPEMREESEKSESRDRIGIEGLYRIREEEYDKLQSTFTDAFSHYPKLMNAYPDWNDRQAAIEMVISYYLAYDFRFGEAYSLDEEINEGLVIVHSDEMTYAEEKITEANCENDRFKAAAARLTDEQVEFWWEFFEEFDRQERNLEIPKPHIYVDYLGVKQSQQGKGNGSRLMEALKAKSEEMHLPVMLFTNGEKDIQFYTKHGFRIIGITESEEFRFRNTYMLYEPEKEQNVKNEKEKR